MVTFSYVRALSVSLWEKSWLKCIILTIAYSLKSVGIVIGCISNHNNTNKHNNCLNLMWKLNGWVITVPCEAIKELVNGEQYEKNLASKTTSLWNLAAYNMFAHKNRISEWKWCPQQRFSFLMGHSLLHYLNTFLKLNDFPL